MSVPGVDRARLCNACWGVETRTMKRGGANTQRKATKRRPNSLVTYLNGPAIQSIRSPSWIVEIASAFAKRFWGRTETFDPFPFEHDPSEFDCLTTSEWYRPGLKYQTYAYCNPPYAQLKLFLDRMVQVWHREGIPSVAVIPHRMHRRYLSVYYGTFPIIPVNGGIRFLDRDYKPYKGVLPEGVCLLMIGPLASPMFGIVWHPQDADRPTTLDRHGIQWKT